MTKNSGIKKENTVFLPGLNEQLLFLDRNLKLTGASVLVVGTGSAQTARYFSSQNNDVSLIVEDYESLISTKLEVENNERIDIKLMDFERTDFPDENFDLIYAQASISDFRRNKIVKELKRVCKPDGKLCIGEIVKLKIEIPNFVNELFESGGLNPLFIDDINKYYSERKLVIADYIDLSGTLKKYYEMSSELLDDRINKLGDSEKAYHKKMLNRISHESNAYLKLGADKFIGFVSIFLTKN